MMEEKNFASLSREAELRRGSRSAQMMNVIVVNTVIGKGTERDPKRVITEYWSLKGELLAVSDPEFNPFGIRI